MGPGTPGGGWKGRWGMVAGVVMLAGAGCSSQPRARPDGSIPEKPVQVSEKNRDFARGALSAVEIRGHPRGTVSEVVESVFTEAGLTVASRSADLLVFEKAGTRGDRARYGGWFGEEVHLRLKVEIFSEGSDVFLLRCRSYVVREPGTYAEDEQSLARRQVREYEQLLNEVAARLN